MLDIPIPERNTILDLTSDVSQYCRCHPVKVNQERHHWVLYKTGKTTIFGNYFESPFFVKTTEIQQGQPFLEVQKKTNNCERAPGEM